MSVYITCNLDGKEHNKHMLQQQQQQQQQTHKMLHERNYPTCKPSPSSTSPSSVAIKSHNIHALSKCTMLCSTIVVGVLLIFQFLVVLCFGRFTLPLSLSLPTINSNSFTHTQTLADCCFCAKRKRSMKHCMYKPFVASKREYKMVFALQYKLHSELFLTPMQINKR